MCDCFIYEYFIDTKDCCHCCCCCCCEPRLALVFLLIGKISVDYILANHNTW